MPKEILLGDEAVALGAVHAGLSGAYSYPGTPASEIMEYLIRVSGGGRAFHAAWSVNEKTAFEEALGCSFAGRRAFVSFKHVGLNVAADPFMSAALTGAQGGFVVCSADDPSMHSSQNEQDSRFYAQFAQIPCFEPADHQEAYDMTREAYDLSERLGLPVMVRLTTRLSHSRAGVETRPAQPQNPVRRGAKECWTLLPSNARERFKRVLALQADLVRYADGFALQPPGPQREGPPPGDHRLGPGLQLRHGKFPRGGRPALDPQDLHATRFRRRRSASWSAHVDTVLVVEEGFPLIERSLRGMYGIPGKTLRGKLDGALPLQGELSPETVRAAVGLAPLDRQSCEGFPLAGRPPQLCVGCPHADTFKALKTALAGHPDAVIFSDIGCYTLGYFPPHNAVDTCVCMGASVGMAHGAAKAGIHPAVGVIGDSTFGHSGITALLSAAAADADMVQVILDNGTVAMTGTQPSFATGSPPPGGRRAALGIAKEHVRIITPLPKFHEENTRVFREEIAHPGLSVVIAVRECLEEAKKKNKFGGAQ